MLGNYHTGLPKPPFKEGPAAPLIGAIAGAAASTYITTGAILTGGFASASLAASMGMGLTIAGAIGGALVSTTVTGLISDSPDQPDFGTGSTAASGMLVNKAANDAPIPVVYGLRRVGGTRVLMEVTGDNNEYLHIVLVLSEGEIESIEDVYLNDVLSTDTRFSGFLTTYPHTGADDQLADTELFKRVIGWTNNHRLRGTAYLYAKLKYDRDAYQSGLPTITADVKGVKVYDPRTSTTAWSDNPALCIRDYLTNSRYGRGIDSSLIDDSSFIAAANYCDETVSIGGSLKARYTLNGVVDTSNRSMDALKKLLTSCRGFLVFSGGKYKLVIDKPETAAFTFSEDNIVGAWSITLGGKNSQFNRIRANFFNPARSWQPDIAVIDSATVRTQQDNGLLLEKTIDLPFTSDIDRAKMITTLNLNQSRQQIACEFTATIEGLRCEVGDVVNITHTTPGWVSKKFRVMRLTLQNNDEVRVLAVEYDANVYDFGTIAPSDAAPDTNLPDMSVVQPPTNFAYTESLFFTPPSVHGRLELTWDAAPDIFVDEYVIQWYSNGDWREVGRTASSPFLLDDLAIGTYQFRVWAVNVRGVGSSILQLNGVEVKGTTVLSTVGTPAVDSVTESLYVTTNGSGVKAKARLVWGASSGNADWEAIGVYIDRYECERKLSTDAKWTRFGETDGLAFDFLDQDAGVYDFRVRAVNQAGVVSTWSSVRQVLYGLTARPADITGLNLQIINGQAHFGWSPATDLDVKVGGTIRFRHSNVTSGAEWKNGFDIGQQVAGSTNGVVLPLLSGSYMAKAVDSTGNESANPAIVVTNVPSLLNFNLVQSSTQEPAFSGTKTNMIVDSTAVPPVLKLESDVAWDSITDYMDDWGLIDAVGGLDPAGSYEFDSYIDTGFSQTYRVTPTLSFTVGDTTDTIDQRTASIDVWNDFDDNGKDITDVTGLLYISTTDDDPSGSPTWSSWQRFVVGDYIARAVKFKIDVAIEDTSHQIYISNLSVQVDAPDRTEWQKGITSGVGVYSVTYSTRFGVDPMVGVTAQDMDSGDYYTITNESETGFDIQFFNSSDAAVSRTFNYFSRGH